MTQKKGPYLAIGATTESARAIIEALGPVSSTPPTPGQVPVWNGTSWVPGAGGGGGGGESGLGEFIFSDFGTQDEAQGRYTSWTDLFTKLATIQIGAKPVVRLALTTGSFIVPLAGMPLLGWDMRGGRFASFYGATGSTVLELPSGVKLDNCFGIGEGSDPGGGAVVLKISPPAGTGVLEFSALPPGSASIFTIGGGCVVDHSTDTGALMRSPGIPGSPTTMVMVVAGANQNAGLGPALTGPLLELVGDDGPVSVQQMAPGGLPDDWLVGGGPGSFLVKIYDIFANPNTLNDAVWVPNFTGPASVAPFPLQQAGLLAYTAASPADWDGAPTLTADAIDRLAAAVRGLLGFPIP